MCHEERSEGVLPLSLCLQQAAIQEESSEADGRAKA
jgi:hypothetical protein